MTRSLLNYASPPVRFDVTQGRGSNGKPHLVLVAAAPAPEDAPWLPLPSATFRALADVPFTAEGVRTFAQQFGWLTAPEPYTQIVGYPGTLEGEPLSTWQNEIGRIRRWVAVWEAWRSEDLGALATAIDVALTEFSGNTDVMVSEDPNETDAWLTAWKSRKGVGKKPPKSLGSDAPAILAVGISGELEQVLALPHSSVRLAVTEFNGGFALAPRSLSLLGAVWLQFAQALADGLTVRRCQSCGKWIEIGPGALPKNRLYCSPRCKLRWFREHQGT